MRSVEHYFTSRPTSERIEYEIKATLRGRPLLFKSCSGIFSAKKLDKGTKILIDAAKVKGRTLDLGCGYGAVGIAISPEAEKVILADVNKRAGEYAKKNLKANKTQNARVLCSDGFEKIPEIFDTILFNPPISAGLDTVFKMINESHEHLNPAGYLEVVARHNKGGRRIAKKMEELFGNFSVIGKSAGYYVYLSEKK